MEQKPEENQSLNNDAKPLSPEEDGRRVGDSNSDGGGESENSQKKRPMIDKILIVMVMAIVYSMKGLKFVWKTLVKGYGAAKAKCEVAKEAWKQHNELKKQTQAETLQAQVVVDDGKGQNGVVPVMGAGMNHECEQTVSMIIESNMNDCNQNTLKGQPAASGQGGVQRQDALQPQILVPGQMVVPKIEDGQNMAGQQNQVAYSVPFATVVQQNVETMNQSEVQNGPMAPNQTYAYPPSQYVNPNQLSGQAQNVPQYPYNIQNQPVYQNQQNKQNTSPGLDALGLIVGVVMGVPLSYYFQPPLVRAKLTLGDYLSRIGGVLEEPELTMRLVVTCIVCGLIGAAIGRAIRHL